VCYFDWAFVNVANAICNQMKLLPIYQVFFFLAIPKSILHFHGNFTSCISMGTLRWLGCLWYIHSVVEQRFFCQSPKAYCISMVILLVHFNEYSTLASVFVVHAICSRTKVRLVDKIMCL